MNNKIPYILLSLVILGFSCSLLDPGPVDQEITLPFMKSNGVFVMNEGNYMAGNGSLSFYSSDSSKIYNNIFSGVNKRPLGDIPYSMAISGEMAYIVVNNSGKIEVINRSSLESAGTISGLISPRQMLVVSEDKAYVSSLYSDYLTVIDLKSNSVSGKINLRRSSEAMLLLNHKVYISSWFSGNELIIVDARNDNVIDSIIVGHEPESMVFDRNDDLWVLCSGGYSGLYYPELVCINTSTDEIDRKIIFPSKQDMPSSLAISKSRDTMYFINKDIWQMAIGSFALPAKPFLEKSGRNYYRLGADIRTNDIFVTNALDFQQRGYLLRINPDGSLVDSVKADIIPGNLFFRSEYQP